MQFAQTASVDKTMSFDHADLELEIGVGLIEHHDRLDHPGVILSVDTGQRLPQEVGSVSDTMSSPQSPQVQAGMRWPHQIWREMVQSLRFSIQWK